MMHLIPFYVYRAERSGRAEVLAGAAADALVLVYGRHLHRSVRVFVVYHLDGSCRAVTCAVAARYSIGKNYTIFLNPHGMADMDGGLFFSRDGLNGTGRAYLAATCTFGTAIAALKRHRGLHEVHQVGGGT